MTTNTTPTLWAYGEALDDIYALRTACAYEALVARGHLTYVTIPAQAGRLVAQVADHLADAAKGRARSMTVTPPPDVRVMSRRAAERAILARPRSTFMRSTEAAPVEQYERALDEILALRRVAAAAVPLLARAEEYRTFPASRRSTVRSQIARLRRAAAGDQIAAYADISTEFRRLALREAGAPQTLTRHQWESER